MTEVCGKVVMYVSRVAFTAVAWVTTPAPRVSLISTNQRFWKSPHPGPVTRSTTVHVGEVSHAVEATPVSRTVGSQYPLAASSLIRGSAADRSSPTLPPASAAGYQEPASM